MKNKLNCILLIDDDEPTNFLNRITLEDAGCTRQVQIARSGKAALDYLNEAANPKPELIFLDINMPAMDGWEFLEHYRRLPEPRKTGIVVIMLTTSLNPDDELRTREIPEVACFENKPLLKPRLESILDRFFG